MIHPAKIAPERPRFLLGLVGEGNPGIAHAANA